MSVFADHLDLRTAVVEHVKNPTITDVFPRLIQLAEVYFNRRLRTRDQMTTATLNVSGGSAALPTDFQELIGVFNGRGVEYINQPIQSLADQRTAGYYAISGGYLVSKADEALTVNYYAKIPTISATLTDSNWLLLRHPGLYLYGVGLEAAKYLRDVEVAQATAEMLEMEFQAAQAEDEGQRYMGARIRVQGPTP